MIVLLHQTGAVKQIGSVVGLLQLGLHSRDVRSDLPFVDGKKIVGVEECLPGVPGSVRRRFPED